MADRPRRREGFAVMRLLFVLSSFAPLFVLWAVKGTSLIPDLHFLIICGSLAVGPTLILLTRICIATRRPDQHELILGPPQDHSQYLLGYLFAILLPFYRQEFEQWRDFAALWVAFAFIVFLFWDMRLHYLNIIFRVGGYRIYSIAPRDETDDIGRGESWILLTRRRKVHEELSVTAIRITDCVYMDVRQ